MRFKQAVYWITTAILCGIMMYSAQLSVFNTSLAQNLFVSYNYPSYLVLPLAIAKVLGVIVILWRPHKGLTEWAYAGLFFDLVLATLAHYHAGETWYGLSFIGLVVLGPSYKLGNYLRG